jgi:hypothetical protein
MQKSITGLNLATSVTAIQNSQGQASGLATLDATTHLVAAQLPTNALVSAQLGATGGIATLTGTTLTAAQIPATVVLTASVGAASGLATLDSTTHLVAAQLPTNALTTTSAGAASGLATLDATTHLTAAQLPTNVVISSQLGATNGVATLTTGTLTPAQIPASVITTAQLALPTNSNLFFPTLSQVNLPVSNATSMEWFQFGVYTVCALNVTFTTTALINNLFCTYTFNLPVPPNTNFTSAPQIIGAAGASTNTGVSASSTINYPMVGAVIGARTGQFSMTASLPSGANITTQCIFMYNVNS